MKSILSPYSDNIFNKYLLKYTKKCLKRKCSVFELDENSDREYEIDDIKYTNKDIINSLTLDGRSICFSNQPLINHVVYDLGQRFWYEELKRINNIIFSIYLEFNNKYRNLYTHIYSNGVPK